MKTFKAIFGNFKNKPKKPEKEWITEKRDLSYIGYFSELDEFFKKAKKYNIENKNIFINHEDYEYYIGFNRLETNEEYAKKLKKYDKEMKEWQEWYNEVGYLVDNAQNNLKISEAKFEYKKANEKLEKAKKELEEAEKEKEKIEEKYDKLLIESNN